MNCLFLFNFEKGNEKGNDHFNVSLPGKTDEEVWAEALAKLQDYENRGYTISDLCYSNDDDFKMNKIDYKSGV